MRLTHQTISKINLMHETLYKKTVYLNALKLLPIYFLNAIRLRVFNNSLDEERSSKIFNHPAIKCTF